MILTTHWWTDSTFTSLIAAMAAVAALFLTAYIFHRQKKNRKTDIEREYINRYNEHFKVIGFVEKNLTVDGQLKPEEERTEEGRPEVGELIAFIRFVKGLYADIVGGTVKRIFAKQWFYKVPIAIYRYPFFQTGLESYDQMEWDYFRKYCKDIIDKDN